MFETIYYQKLRYKEYKGKSSSNTDLYDDEILIDGLRIRGDIKITHSDDGDTTTCNIVYRTRDKLVAKSLLNGREIMECVPVAGLGLNCGYVNYVK